MPELALAMLFRGRFLELAAPALQLPHIPWDERWVVFAKPVARPSVVLDYLARYVHRTALSDKASPPSTTAPSASTTETAATASARP